MVTAGGRHRWARPVTTVARSAPGLDLVQELVGEQGRAQGGADPVDALEELQQPRPDPARGCRPAGVAAGDLDGQGQVLTAPHRPAPARQQPLEAPPGEEAQVTPVLAAAAVVGQATSSYHTAPALTPLYLH